MAGGTDMTNSPKYHLAQINIAALEKPLDDPANADFVAQLNPVNEAADKSPGFVWRLKSEDGYVSGADHFSDPLIIVNLTVWSSIEALWAYTYSNQDHLAVLKARRRWFKKSGSAFALWWIPAGHLPTLEEGRHKLTALAQNGPTVEAFTFKQSYPEPELKDDHTVLVFPS